MNYPIGFAERAKPCGKGFLIGQSAQIAEESEFSCAISPSPNSCDSTRTFKKKPVLQATLRLPSGDRPPLGTIICT